MPNYLTKQYSNQAIGLYFSVLVVCNLVFFSHTLPVIWWLFGIIEVVGFFYYSNLLTRTWSKYSDKKFVKKLFMSALFIRLAWVIFSYIFFTAQTGSPFEFNAGDSLSYHDDGLWVRGLIINGDIQPYLDYRADNLADSGYTMYLGFVYFLTNNSIFIARIIKALIGAYTCILIYRLAVRNFGEVVGRMSAIFCMLMPNLIYYTGLHLKEVEMVFLTIAFVNSADSLFRNKNFNFVEIAPPLFYAALLFFFRTVLGGTALFAMFTTLMFSSARVIAMGKRVVLIVWIMGTLTYFIGGSISNEIESVWSARQQNQEQSMKWRTTRKNGNKFAKYATGAVFAPMIFAIPFPTIVDTPEQEGQKLIHGGNYVKNFMAFFTIFAVFWIVKNGKWREYILIGSFTIGYLLVLAMSAFAQSERFHQPSLPLELVFAAFGLSIFTKKERKYHNFYLSVLFLIIVGWSWFKLAGRGMI